MDDLAITWTTALAILAGLLVIMNFIDKIKEWKKPTVDRDKQIEDISQKLDRDNRRIKQTESSIDVLLQTQLAIIDHMITGNNVDHLKAVQKDLRDFLVSRKII